MTSNKFRLALLFVLGCAMLGAGLMMFGAMIK